MPGPAPRPKPTPVVLPPHAAALTALERKELLLSLMNDKHAVVNRNGTTCVVTFDYNPGLGRETVYYSTFHDIKNIYTNQYITNERKDPSTGETVYSRHALGNYWLSWPGRKTYDGVAFAPGRKLEKNYLNLWQGWGVTPAPGDWPKFKLHIHDVICSGNEEHYQYLLNWMARAVQMPDKPGEVAVVLRGERGAGKGVFCNTFGRLFGPHYLQITSTQHLTGQFNAHLETCALLFLDEAMWAGDHQGEGVLKGLITESTIAVRPMRTNMYHAPNCLHILMATNSEWAVPAGAKERRFLVLDVNNLHQQDTAYFGQIATEMSNGGLAAMLHDLLARDISTFNVRKVPQTSALREQQVLSLSAAENWWYDKLSRGEIFEDQNLWPTEVSVNALHQDYMRVLGSSGIRRRGTATAMGIMLRRLVPGLEKKRGVYTLPGLKDARNAWDKLMRTVTEWEGDE